MKKNTNEKNKTTNVVENKKENFGIKLNNPEYYINRELSWLMFDERILGEAKDKNIPLFERLKFLSIVSSNLDEFYMVRVASLKDMVDADYTKKDIAGMTPRQQLAAISVKTHELVASQYSTYNRSLIPALSEIGLTVVRSHEELTETEGRFVDEYFEENVYPVLTPMAVDSSRPFPLIRNKSLNIGALLRRKDKAPGKDKHAGKEVTEFANGDETSTLIRTEKGKTMLIEHDVMTPRPYSRMYQVVGTDGYASKYPIGEYCLRVDKPADKVDARHISDEKVYRDEEMEALQAGYRNVILTPEFEELAKSVGGHGGMDFIMDYRLVYCLHHGLPLDMDVYDLAEWCCVAPLSRVSLENGSMPVEVPDFTRGAWNRVKGFHYALAEGEK